MRRMLAVAVSSCAVLLAGGCPPEDYTDLVPATQSEIKRIHDDATLTAQEQRTQLEALGLSPLTINAVLRDKQFGNQFGGDARSAYQKVTRPDFLTLTPDEIQIFASLASSVDSTLSVSFTDAQAQDIVTSFAQFDVSSPQKLAALLEQSPDAVPGSVTADALRKLFVGFDPTLVLPKLP